MGALSVKPQTGGEDQPGFIRILLQKPSQAGVVVAVSVVVEGRFRGRTTCRGAGHVGDVVGSRGLYSISRSAWVGWPGSGAMGSVLPAPHPAVGS